ncbi:MAG: hypothetical protein JSW40_09415 [Candidatus Omnitrophota bacterium]|nr:MAG: hypothetical protein JSW40_09415 [Candidatus Omnitrophota bacterium]
MRKIYIFFMVGFMFAFFSTSFGEEIEERFGGKQKLCYKVRFNGIPAGKVEWTYLGKVTIGGREANALHIDSNTKILEFFNLISKEKVFLDVETHLPIRVERDIVFFGKKELIQEIYNQDEGYVRIIKSNSRTKEEVLRQDKPIHNILSLLYFFPKDVELKKDTSLVFNLPTQKVIIKVESLKNLSLGEDKRQAVFLIGKGAKRFNLWLDKQERIPLRLEFPVPLGKIIILKEN